MLKESKTNITENMMEPSMRLLKLYLTQSLFTFSYIYLLGIMGENMAAGLKNRLFERIIKQDISFYDRTRSGELIDRLTTDIQDFKVTCHPLIPPFKFKQTKNLSLILY
jgi:ATP-binding cassette subfamily B (MDR/TAP) protein 8